MASYRRVTLLALLLSPLCFPKDPEPTAADPVYKPLIGQARVRHYFRQTWGNPGLYGAALGGALSGQISNSPPEWGGGVQGYSTRAASAFGILLTQATIHEGTAALFHVDPRYIRSGGQGFGHRLGHAVGWTFVTYDEHRRIRPNLPIAMGAYGSGMISQLWYPGRFNPLTDGVRLGSQQMAFSVGINIVKEFSPELKRLIRKR